MTLIIATAMKIIDNSGRTKRMWGFFFGDIVQSQAIRFIRFPIQTSVLNGRVELNLGLQIVQCAGGSSRGEKRESLDFVLPDSNDPIGQQCSKFRLVRHS